MEITKKYTNGEVTVVWQPSKCIHSTICFKSLPTVFNPRKRPWVTLENEDTNTIVEQVKACPSSALSYFMNNESKQESHSTETTLVEVLRNGPLVVYGNLKVKDNEGNESTQSEKTAFCRCGASSTKPYCDGTHVKITFEG